MAEPLRKSEDSPRNADEAKQAAAEYHRQAPLETETHGMEREPNRPSLNEEIRARIPNLHKGDVGRPGTNEEVYQGSKQKELK